MIKFKVGDRVRVKHFNTRPKHWNPKGEMDKWMGKEVKISSLYKYNSYNKYMLKECNWVWRDGDFESVDFLEDKDFLI